MNQHGFSKIYFTLNFTAFFFILCAFSTFVVYYTFPCVLEIFSHTTNTKQNKVQP